MTTVIREDELSRYFDLVIDLWPTQLTLDSADKSTLRVLDGSCLQKTYLAVRRELRANVEDWDLQVSTALTAAIYKFLRIKSQTHFSVVLSRDCIDKAAVMDIMDQYQTWSVLRKETC